jgi:hypothetical protein
VKRFIFTIDDVFVTRDGAWMTFRWGFMAFARLERGELVPNTRS